MFSPELLSFLLYTHVETALAESPLTATSMTNRTELDELRGDS